MRFYSEVTVLLLGLDYDARRHGEIAKTRRCIRVIYTVSSQKAAISTLPVHFLHPQQNRSGYTDPKMKAFVVI